MFEDLGGINISERDENYFILEYLKPVDTDKLKQSDNYQLYCSGMEEIFNQRNEYMTTALQPIKLKH